MKMPSMDDMPYENASFFKKLFSKISVMQVIEVFTYILFEKSVLLVAEDVQDLLPIMFALKSFVYPFRIGVYIPHLHDD